MTGNNQRVTPEIIQKLMQRDPLARDQLHSGLSIEDAIVIKGTEDTRLGLFYERYYLEELFPGSSLLGQSLIQDNNKIYDLIKFHTADGNMSQLYFDITEFFGKITTI